MEEELSVPEQKADLFTESNCILQFFFSETIILQLKRLSIMKYNLAIMTNSLVHLDSEVVQHCTD